MTKEEAISYLQQLYPNGGHCWLDEQRIEAIDMAVKTLQEEHVSEPINFEQELYKYFGQVKDFTLGMRVAERFYEMGKQHQEPVSDDLESASDDYATKLVNKTTEFGVMDAVAFDGYCIMDAFKDGANWQKEQFEKNRLKHCNSITNEQAELEQGFIYQHLDKYNRMPTFLDAIEYGMKLQEQKEIEL